MSIQIQSLPGGLVQNAGDTTQMIRPQGDGVTPRGATPVRAPDTLSLTNGAAHLRHLEGTLNALPIVDTKRVEGVRQVIAAGRFTVDAQSSANRLLGMERDLP